MSDPRPSVAVPFQPREKRAEQANETAEMLQAIYSPRKRMNLDQVNFIRESVLLDKVSVPKLCKELHPPMTPGAVWAIARGTTYKTYPLSLRLKRAYGVAREKRKVPVNAENLIEGEDPAP